MASRKQSPAKSTPNRPTRPDLPRTEPIRSWSTLFGAPPPANPARGRLRASEPPPIRSVAVSSWVTGSSRITCDRARRRPTLSPVRVARKVLPRKTCRK